MKRKLLLVMAFVASIFGANAWDGSEGKVYLQNVGSGLWWGAGNAWGTQASLLQHPEYVTLHLSDGKYTLESQVSNGGTAYYFEGDYMDNGNPVSLAITAVGENWKIAKADNSATYGYDGSSTVMGKNVDASTANGQWRIYTEAEMLANLANATVENPVDATFLFLDPNFGRNNRNVGSWTMDASNKNLSGGNNVNNCAESFHSTFTLSQAVAEHPAGVYKVTAQGFYRQDGSDNDNLPYFYVNDVTSTFPLKTGAENSMSDASASFTSGNYMADAMYISVTENQGLTIGAKLETNTGLWCIWDNFVITYYGDVTIAEVKLANFVSAYKTALAAAQAYVDVDMFDADKTALNTTISNNTVDLNNTTETELTTAAANLTAAANAAAIAAAKYSTYSAVSTAIQAGTTNVDITGLITNLDFQTGNLTGWTSADGGNVANNGNFNATYFVERWKNGVALGNGSLTHDALYLPAGIYYLTADAQNIEQYNNATAGTGLFFYANEDKVEIGAKGSYAVATVLASDGDLSIKFVQDNCTGNWIAYDNITVTYFAQASDPYTAAVAAANATLADDLYNNITGSERTAVSNEISDGTNATTLSEYLEAAAKLDALVATFTAAKKNYDLYASELDIAQTISNTITVDAPTTSDEALAAFKTLKVAEYNFVATEYPFSATSKIGEFSTWTRTGTVNGAEKNDFEALTSQHWSGTAMTYYEQPATGWDNNAWTANYEKKTTLPAGDYIIKVAARAASSGATTASISCQGLTAPIPTLGDTGKGITTAGKASFDEGTFANDGNGRGWVWSYLPFTLTAETEVTMTVVAEATGTHQWFSVCDGELLSKTNIATAVAYDETANNNIEDVDVANVTITRKIKADYNSVVLPFDLTANQVQAAFGSGTEVYAFSEDGEADAEFITISFNKVVEGTISANVPVLVKATTVSSEQIFNGVQVVAPTADVKVAGTNENASFVGVYAPETIGEGHFFIGGGALYKSKGATNINAFRAFVELKNPDAATPVKMFIDGLETSINAINGVEAEQGAIFNLAGQRVQKAVKGIYVINGKKVLVK